MQGWTEAEANQAVAYGHVYRGPDAKYHYTNTFVDQYYRDNPRKQLYNLHKIKSQSVFCCLT